VKLTFHNHLVCRLGIVELHVCPLLHVRDLVLSNEHFCHFLLLRTSVYLCVEQNDLLISEVIIGPVWTRFSFRSLTVLKCSSFHGLSIVTFRVWFCFRKNVWSFGDGICESFLYRQHAEKYGNEFSVPATQKSNAM
jgi:hypothetical protein